MGKQGVPFDELLSVELSFLHVLYFLPDEAAGVLACTEQSKRKGEPADTENPDRMKTDPPCPKSLILRLFRQVMIFPLAARSRLLLEWPG